MFSAGDGSMRAALIDRARHPRAEFGLVFTDGLYEDADAYRYLIEGAAHVLGRHLSWVPSADDFPDYRVSEDTPIEEYRGNAEWRAFLRDLRARTVDALPELQWLVEGRDPWEVFRDNAFLGNDNVDLCSRVLKREMADKWRTANCHRIGELYGPPDYFAVGIGEHEAHRFDDGQGGGIGPRNLADGWLYHAPLLTDPADFPSLFFAPLEQIGPKPPRLYGMGYMHNNCGGFCCRAGQAHYANRFRVQPVRFTYDALMERKLVRFLGKNVSMLTDRRGGTRKPMTLDEFAERLREEPRRAYEYEPGESGCGCMGAAA
ncbi:MAG: hypothetical protein A2792_00285 [Sphingomonadales bacterium RIFCSPHIGHO2_01_FULL_65_20]|nr:MAG: hypothetical protein A2792_00285 [Sphingomonadales bacterium RIFCSPHIGHO2_01_FULL_65_20]